MTESVKALLPLGAAVLVTGATGFTGQHLVRALVQRGAQVRAIARARSSRETLSDVSVDWRVGELREEAFVREAMRGVEYVFHLATSYRQASSSAQEQRDIHVTSTQHLAHAASAEPGFKRFIHVSTVGVHSHIAGAPASESQPFAPGDEYQRTKLEGELWLSAYARSARLPAAVVRPAAIYGPGDRRLFKIFKMATWPVVPLVGRGRCLYHLIHVSDLVDFLQRVAVHPAAVGETFICAGPEPISIMDFVRCAGACYGKKNRFVRLPEAPLMAAARVCERVCRILRVQPPLYPRRVAFFTKDRAFDTTKMQTLLGFQARIGNEEGIRATARWYADHGWLPAR